MPAEVLDDPPGISCVFSDGQRVTMMLSDLAGRQLAQDLLTGLAELIHPHGAVDAKRTVRIYVKALRSMTSALADRGFTSGAAALCRAQVAEFWIGTTADRETCTRRMLLGFAAAGGTLDTTVRELAEGRAFNPHRYRSPLPPYPEAEWSRLTQTCLTAVTAAYRQHQDALAGAARGQDLATGGCDLDNLRWLLARNGPMTARSVVEAHAATSPARARRAGLLQAAAGLFPHLDVTVCAAARAEPCCG
jgi:hypothetical protein